MSSALPALLPARLPALARTLGRSGARIACSGALAIGLLTSAPTADAHASSVSARTGTTVAQRATTGAAVHRKRHHHVNRVARAMGVAAAQKGDPYAYGAAGPNRFDCSGLTFYSYRRAGFHGVPRTSSAQAHWARHIKRSNLRRGDLIFFTGGGGVYHVGVYAGWKHGRRLVLHAPYSGARVRTEPIWTNSWFAGTLRGRR